jgi:hypothetical protein
MALINLRVNEKERDNFRKTAVKIDAVNMRSGSPNVSLAIRSVMALVAELPTDHPLVVELRRRNNWR